MMDATVYRLFDGLRQSLGRGFSFEVKESETDPRHFTVITHGFHLSGDQKSYLFSNRPVGTNVTFEVTD